MSSRQRKLQIGRFVCGFFLACACLGVTLVPRSGRSQTAANEIERERSLRHIRLSLDEILLWDDDHLSNKQLVPFKPVLVVHLFSLDCPPCLEELPSLKEVFHGNWKDVQFAMVLETLDEGRIREFLRTSRSKLPEGVPLYVSTDRRIRDTSQLGINTIPVTLLLDKQRVVRQSFVGGLKDRMHELTRALSGLQKALTKEPLPIESGLKVSQKLQSEHFLHHHVNMAAMSGSSHLRLRVLYLHGPGCKECAEDLDGRLKRMMDGWSGIKDVRFAVVDCGPQGRDDSTPPSTSELPEKLAVRCSDGNLNAIWAHDQRPLTLLLDSTDVVRDAFFGPISSRTGIALQRLYTVVRP